MMKIKLFLLTLLVCLSAEAQDSWVIKVDSINRDKYFGVTVGNGMIGVVSSPEPLKTKTVILAGTYDRPRNGGVSSTLSGFNMLDMTLAVNGEEITSHNISNFHQQLDMRRAVFSGQFNYKDLATISYDILALRQLPFNTVMSVVITPNADITVKASNIHRVPGGFKDAEYHYDPLSFGSSKLYMITTEAVSPMGRLRIAASSTFNFPDGNDPEINNVNDGKGANIATFEKTLKKGEKYRFCIMGATISSNYHSDVRNEVERLVISARMEGYDKLLAVHEKEWNDLWSSDIIVDGEPQMQQDVHNMIYHLYSFVREGSDLSISPMGLSGHGYNGHIFWDSELWMYPSMLLLHPELARSMINYRYNRLSQAKQLAYEHGYDGAMFPWESAGSGDEDTPVSALTGPYEHHITGCIGFAAWNYYCVTHDKYWLQQKGFPLIKNTADFWASRVTIGDDGLYHILNVVGADEYADNVDDNAFTNGVAKRNLECAVKAARVLGEPVNPRWQEVASKIAFPKFTDGINKEFTTYNKGRKIKQADVNLLTYPLRLVTDAALMRKNLEYYSSVVDNGGPAMSQSIYSIVYNRLGDAAKSYKLLQEASVDHYCPPFRVMSEGRGGTNPFFVTGAGGILQSFLNGFGGLEITDNGITQVKSVLPANWKKLTLKGIGVERRNYEVVNH